MKRIFLLIVFLAASQQGVYAACEIDRFGVVYCGRGNCAKNEAGEVFCSKYQFGHAMIDKLGNVVCGKGECVASVKFNDYYCSTVENGGANRDRFGEVKCYGGCEKASASMCESSAGQ